MMRVRLENHPEEITLGTSLITGGEADIFVVPGRPELLAKVYHQPTAEHEQKLAAILSQSSGHRPGAVAWPLERLLGESLSGGVDSPVVGYVMPRIDGVNPISEYANPSARRKTCPLFHYGYLVRTARNLAATVAGLHEAGFVLGDLNESNVLVTSQATVTLVDADSFQFHAGDRVFRCPVGKPEFTPPELQGAFFGDMDRMPEHDVFALGVLIFQLLMQGVHPFAGKYEGEGDPPSLAERIKSGWWPYALEKSGPIRPAPHAPGWEVLPPPVQDLFWRCFEDGHFNSKLRPTAREWHQALEESEQALTPCTLNPQHQFPHGLDVCPWCVLEQQQERDPFPSREELEKRRQRARAVRALARSVPPTPPLPAPGSYREDPLPVILTSRPSLAEPSLLENGLQMIGALVEKTPWSIWLAAAALGTLVGVLWTLEVRP